MSDLRRAAGISRTGHGDGVRRLPQERAQQDPLRPRSLCLQQLPHPGAGRHLRALPGVRLHRPDRPHSADDGDAVLPHARPGAPCDGGRGAADRLQKRGRGAGTGTGPAGDRQPRPGCAGRGLRILGRLRGGRQRRAVHGHRDPLDTAGRRALGPEQPHDRPGAGSHRPGGRAAVLQAGFLAGDPGLPSTSHGSSWA